MLGGGDGQEPASDRSVRKRGMPPGLAKVAAIRNGRLAAWCGLTGCYWGRQAAVRRRQAAPQESALAALLNSDRCTPLRFEQRKLQKIVVPTCPVPGFPLMPFLQKAELREQCQGWRVVRVYLRLDSIQLHLSEAPGDDCLERFFCVSVPLMRRSDFVSNDTGSPVSIPAKQAARTHQPGSVFQLHGPARSGDRLFAPARKRGDELFGAIKIGNRIRPEPSHVLAVTMDLKQTFGIRLQNLTQCESRCLKR